MRLALLIPTVGLSLALAACANQPYPPQSAAQSGSTAPATTAAPASQNAAAPATQSAAAPTAAPTAASATTSPAPTTAEPAVTKPDLGETLSPPDAFARAEPGEEPAASDASSGWVSKYPYGSATSEAEQAASVAPAAGSSSTGLSDEPSPAEPTVQAGSTGWIKADVTSEEHQADIEACYSYAFSQVEHDFRIDNDVAAARPGDSDNGLGFTALTTRMNLYDQRNRRTELINSCMEGKGYIPA